VSKNVDIHATAIVDGAAELGVGVKVGPYSIVGADVVIGDRSEILAHAVVEGPTTLGSDNRIHQFASIGTPPQDQKYAGEPTRLEVGDRNTVREFVTMNRGTVDGGGTSRVGSDNLFMAYAHVAHDCTIGDNVVMANAATLAGHVEIDDFAIVGGLVAIHQHVRIGESAILGGGAMVSQDVPPYCMAAGDRARLYGLNLVGLKRRGVDASTLSDLKSAYRVLFQSKLRRAEAIEQLKRDFADSAEVGRMIRFVESSTRGVCR